MDPDPARTPPNSPRWWILGLIGAAAVAAAVIVVWVVPHRSQQHVNLNLARILLIALGAAALWLLALSRLPWRTRWLVLGLTVLALGALPAVFRIHGVDGNLIPIVEWRWKSPATIPSAITSPLETPSTVVGAADFPQFLGPHRTGALDGPRLAADWTARPPKLQWRQPVGAGWSGFSIAGAIAVTQEQRAEEEVVAAYDLATGRPLWTHADRVRYASVLAGVGPRATPTIVDDHVIALGATGRLNCLERTTGRLLWSINVVEDNGAQIPDWGVSGSPLVIDDLVVVNPGGPENRTLAAYAIADGSRRWTGGTRGATYSSPLAATVDGTPQILLFGGGLTGYDARTGTVLWEFPWPGGHPHVAMPVRLSETDWMLSSGYGTGSGRISLARAPDGTWSASEIWRTNRLKSKFANPVVHRGHAYGLDDGVMACLDAATGKLQWRDGKYGHGQILLVGEHILVMAEKGEVILLDPQPDRLHELTRFSALTGKTWNPPALAGRFLVVRNDQEAACFRLPVE